MPGVSAMDPNVTDFRPRGNSSGSGGGVSVNKIASLFQPKSNGPSQQQPEIDRSRSQSRGEALERSSSTDVRSGYDNKAKFSNARQLFETLGSKPILSEQIVKSTAIRSPQVVRRRTFTPSPPRNEKFTSPTNGQSDPTTTRLDQSFSPRNRAGPPPVPPKPKSVGGDSPDKRKSPGSASGTLERPKEIPPKPTERRSPPLISGSRSPPQQTQMKEDSPLSEVTRQFHELVNNIERMSSTTVSHTIYSNSAPPTVLSPPINSDTQLAKPVYATVVSPVKSPVTSPVRFIQTYPGSPVKTGFGVPRTTSLSQGLSEVADSPSSNNAEPSTSDSGGDSADSHGFNHIPTAVAAISCRYPRITQVLNTSERSANTTTPSTNTGANGNGITSPTGANSKLRPSSLLPTISSATTVVTSSNVTSALYTSTKPGVVSPTSSDSLSKSSDSLNSQNSGGANSSTKPGKFEPYWRAPDAFYRRYPNETSVPNSADSTVSARNYLLKQQFLAGGSQKNPAADMNGSTSQSTRDQFAAESTGSCSSGQTTTITQSTGLLLTRNATADSSVEPPLPQNLAAAVRRGRLSGSTETRNNGEMSTTVVEPMTVKEAAVLLSPTTREEVLKTDIKSLPTRHHLPSDVDGKRLSSCSIDADPEAFNTAHSAHRNSIPSITEVNWLPDGQFWWAEIPGLRDESPSTPTQESITKTFKVQFSRSPIKVFSTYSGLEYDRRNDDVDPVAASAEYELERRVEKMDKFQVELLKGNDGLGLSIIGMGVGADAGLEKLGIFVKCITPGGAAAKDGRIQVCDQIIEVDGKSLIGVTQAYAAQVLRSTSGTVRFQVGREKDVEKSEIAALIRQSLEQDRVREEQRRQMEQMYRSPPIEMREEPIGAAESNGGRKTDWLTVDSHVNSHQPHSSVNSTDSVFGPEDETPEALSAHNANINQLMEELKQLDFDYLLSTSLQLESNEESLEEAFNMSHHRPELNGVGLASDPEISRLLTESLQEFPPKVVTNFPSNGTELVSASAPTATHQRVSVSYLEFVLEDTKKDAEKFQNLLGESRDQYVDLETKYSMAKKLIKDYQDREREMVEREEAHLQKLREKDAEYNNIVQRLNSKIFELEKQLVEARIAENAIAANAERLIAPPTSPAQDFIPASKAYQPVKRIDSETRKSETQSIGYIRYEESGWECTDSIATSSRDFGVPQTELLDSHVLKAKADAVKQSEVMSARNPPTKRCDTEVEIFCHHTMAGHSHMESVNEGRPVQIETTATATVNHTPGKCSPSKSSSTSASTPTASPIPSKRLAGPFSILLKTKHRADPIAGAKFMAELDLKANCVNQWTCEDVCKLLHGIGLEKYVPEFSVNKIDGQKLLAMDGGKLKSLGVQNHSERALLKKRIKDIKAAIERERKNVVAAVKEGGATKPSAMEKRMSSLKKK